MIHTYTISTDIGSHFNFDCMREVVEEVLPLDFMSSGDDIVSLHFISALSQAQIDTLDALVAAHDLMGSKHFRVAEIEARNKELLITFPHDGESFSFSVSDQANWLGVLSVAAAAGLTYPYDVGTVDHTYYEAADEAGMIAIGTSALTHKGSVISTGSALKKLINKAVDQAAVDAVVDAR